MVALLSQCFSDNNITGSEKNNELTVNKNNDQQQLEPEKNSQYPDSSKPNESELLKKKENVSNDDLTDYIEYLEKSVSEYKNYIEERYEKVNNQKYEVIENFSNGSGNTNDLLLYIVTCIFILLLVDYIFKMGKNSY